MASSGLAYPDRFYAAAAYAGFGAGGATSSAAISRFQNDVALLLYGLHQQVTRRPLFFIILAINSGVGVKLRGSSVR
jgi:hypothetical protein